MGTGRTGWGGLTVTQTVTQIEAARTDAGDTDEGPPTDSVVVCIAKQQSDRGRLAQVLDGVPVVIIVPDAETALSILRSRQDAHHGAALRLADEPTPLAVGELLIDRARARVSWAGEPVALTRLEREVLACLAERPGDVWSYQRLHESAWRSPYLGARDSVCSLVKRLRRKLCAAGAGVTIQAVWGIGFQLVQS